MRSLGSTYFGLDFSVVARTNSRTAFFEVPSFHEGSGSPTASDAGLKVPKTAVAAETLIRSLREIFIHPPHMPRGAILARWKVIPDPVSRQAVKNNSAGVRQEDAHVRTCAQPQMNAPHGQT